MNTAHKYFFCPRVARVWLAVVAAVALGYPGAPAHADGWGSFCNQEKNRKLCIRANAQCERNTNRQLTCGDIRSIFMRYRGYSSSHAEKYAKDVEAERGLKQRVRKKEQKRE